MKDDTISRAAAIEHLKKRLIETAINNMGVTARCDSIFEDTAENRIGTWLNEVPSAPGMDDIRLFG
jgi:D-alanine-D-alanine ligase-like ATP-grasp enzyme